MKEREKKLEERQRRARGAPEERQEENRTRGECECDEEKGNLREEWEA